MACWKVTVSTSRYGISRAVRSHPHLRSDHPPDRLCANSEKLCYLRQWPQLFVPHPSHLDLLGGREGRGPAPDPAPFPGRLEPLLRPLHDPLTLELGDRCENVKDQPSRGGCGVDILTEGPEPRAPGLDQVDNLQQGVCCRTVLNPTLSR